MLVFLDFEASSLSDRSFPIEVAWIFEDGRSECHLIRPAQGWDDWDPESEAIHCIDRATLERDGEPHQAVAARMIEELSGHDLLASAPSWDGKWLSALLRASGLPRHALRLRDTEEARAEIARATLSNLPDAPREAAWALLGLQLEARWRDRLPEHRALADAAEERRRWLETAQAARAIAG